MHRGSETPSSANVFDTSSYTASDCGASMVLALRDSAAIQLNRPSHRVGLDSGGTALPSSFISPSFP